jgi:hypothetical protein
MPPVAYSIIIAIAAAYLTDMLTRIPTEEITTAGITTEGITPERITTEAMRIPIIDRIHTHITDLTMDGIRTPTIAITIVDADVSWVPLPRRLSYVRLASRTLRETDRPDRQQRGHKPTFT